MLEVGTKNLVQIKNKLSGFTIVLSVALSVAVVSFLTAGVLAIVTARKCTCWNAVV